MAGHSKWAQIKRQKGVNDAKRGQLFTRLGNIIAAAAKGGGDPDMNPSLAMAVEKAKAANMPNANIDKAIKRGTGELGGASIEEYTFEGYGHGGVGIIVEGASDNRNRISAEVRTAFAKYGGSLAESGSVMFQFKRKGVIRVKATGEDSLLELLDSGAEDAREEGDEIVLITQMADLGDVRDKVKQLGFKVSEAGLEYIPNNLVVIEDEAQQAKVEKLIEMIEEVEDVTEVYTNYERA